MPVVRKIEACGSSSGRTRQPVVVADCGELPSRRQILAKIAAEKEALADMKKDPLLVRMPGRACNVSSLPTPRIAGQHERLEGQTCHEQERRAASNAAVQAPARGGPLMPCTREEQQDKACRRTACRD